MKLLIGFLEIVGVLVALSTWGIIPALLWDYGYNSLALVTFLVIPFCLFTIALEYEEWRAPRRRRYKDSG
jgi:hypothetical protein